MKRTIVCLAALCVLAGVARAQFANSASGSTTAAAEINAKPAFQLVSGDPNGATAGTAGKDLAFDLVGRNWYLATVTGSPATWVRVEQFLSFSAGLTRSGNAITCAVASGSVAGCLSSADWTTFSAKANNPMTTAGDMVIGGSSGVPARLAAGALDTVLQGGGAGTAPSFVGLVNCGDSSHGLAYSTSTHLWSCQAITGSSGGVADPGSNGVMVRTVLNTTVARTLTGTANLITITNGDGVSGNPTFTVGSNVARLDQGNTFVAGVHDFSSATHLRVPNAAGYTPTVNGHFGYDTTANAFKGYVGATVKTFAFLDSNITGTAGNLAGTPALPNGVTGTTQSQGDNSTKLATTGYVDVGLLLKAPLASPAFTGTVDAAGAAHLRVPNAAGYTPATNGHFGYDTTSNRFKGYSGAAVGTFFDSLTKADALQAAQFCVDAGSTDTYACNLSPAITAYVLGTRYRFKAATANTGAASVNFSAVGALTLKKLAGGITTDLADNDIRAGQWVECVYDGTNCQMVSQIGNAGSGSGDMTAAIYHTTGAGVPSNPCATAGVLYRNSSTTPYTFHLCPSAGGNWVGPLAVYDPTKSGAVLLAGLTSGSAGFAAADIAGTAILYIMPTTNGTSSQVLSDSGVTTCPTLAAGMPTVCHQLAFVAGGGAPAVGSITGAGVAGHYPRSTGTVYADDVIHVNDLPAIATTVNGQTCTIGSNCTVTDATKVPIARTVNGHPLSSDVVVTASDIGVYNQTVQSGGSPQTQRAKLNFAAGANVTITPSDNGSDTTTLTIAATGGGSTGIGRTSLTATYTAIADGACQSQTATWTGATTSDTITLGAPAGLAAGLLPVAFISAADTVAIRLCNLSGASVTPGPTTFAATLAVYNLSGSGTIDFAAISDGACASNTFTLTGVAASDPIVSKWPSTLEAGLFGSMIASATNTVQVRLCNFSGSSVDPASQSFGASVAK